MLVEGDPLLLVGQTVFALGFIATGLYLIINLQENQRLHFSTRDAKQLTFLKLSGLLCIVGGLLIGSGTFASIGLVMVIIILASGLIINLKRRLGAGWDTSIDSEFHIHRIISTLGLSLILLEGPRWGLLTPEVNIVSGVEMTISLAAVGKVLTGLGMVGFAFSMGYDMERLLSAVEREDIPHTRLMLNLTLMLFFSFGVAIMVTELVVVSLLGLVFLWSGLTISIIPMWKASIEQNKTTRMLHIITNFQLIGGFISYIAIYNTLHGSTFILWFIG